MQKGLMTFRSGNEHPKVGINTTKPFCKNLKRKKKKNVHKGIFY